MIDLFFKGILIGLSIAMPVGPIGLLCIRYSLSSGFREGFIAGLGAAVADGLYGAIAGFGVTFLTDYTPLIKPLGALFLCYLGITTFFKKCPSECPENRSLLFLSTFLLTLTNPLTILSFIGIFTALGVSESQGSLLLTAGVFVGSALWWFLLSGCTALFKTKIESHRLNQMSGIFLAGFGIFYLF